LEPQAPVSFQVRSRFPLYLFRRLRCAPEPEKDAAAIGAILEVPFASAGFHAASSVRFGARFARAQLLKTNRFL